MPETPEQLARQKIDAQLVACGWVVQDKNVINLSASRGVAVCELSFATGEPDYKLFVERTFLMRSASPSRRFSPLRELTAAAWCKSKRS